MYIIDRSNQCGARMSWGDTNKKVIQGYTEYRGRERKREREGKGERD